ncbi:hypothetical protein D920_02415 [Enterococcus faecalis 13-SD-W-01]|nr:hypothetical protein D920_02415 [Enterococcus faecalis 13-SD-W-01]
MKIRFTRQTGFYGMGSPIQLLINGKPAFWLNNDQSKEVEVEEHFTVQAKFYLLKSPVYHIEKPKTAYLITMNPKVLRIYLLFFLMFLPIFIRNIVISLLLLILFFFFLFRGLKQAYLIKEDPNEKL